jgi:hypothetical protein
MLYFILYVILLAYFCAPYMARKSGADMQAFLHAIVYWILLIVSIFLFFFLQTLLVTTSYYHVDVVTVDAPSPAPARTAVKIRPPPPPSITFPIRVSEAPPPVPDITPIVTPPWSWPQPTVTFRAPALPSSTPLPSFLPPVQPSSWVTPAAPATPTVAVAGTAAPSSYALAGPPSPCVEEECMPLPPLLPRTPKATLAAAAVAPAPETWNQEALRNALDTYNRNRAAKLPTAEWILYFKPFPKNVVDKLIAVLKSKTDNDQTLIMTRLTEMKSQQSTQKSVQDYILAL